jgi:uncharacterized protein (TIGR02996 family)
VDEAAFLRKLLENPADDTVRLVYADWLEEQETDDGRRKSEFLRRTCELTGPDVPAEAAVRDRLRELAADLDPDWLAVVSRLKLEGCPKKQNANHSLPQRGMRIGLDLFEFVCDKQWDELTPTANSAIRFCVDCKNDVHYCDTITTAKKHARKGHCVAVDIGIPRRKGDLGPDFSTMMVGRPRPETLERIRARTELDPVSKARERRKRDAAGG